MKKKWVRFLFVLLVFVWIISGFLDVMEVKGSMFEYPFNVIILLIIIFLFYAIPFWQLLSGLLMYWFLFMVLREFTLFMSCLLGHYSYYEYVGSKDVPWHWFQIISMLINTFGVLLFVKYRRNKSLIEFKNTQGYIFLSLAISIGMGIVMLVFDFESIYRKATGLDVMLIGTITMLVFSILVILIILKSYFNIKQKKELEKMSHTLLDKQYHLLKEMYDDKRRQIHDSVQHNILLGQYLRYNRITEAQSYLEEIVQKVSERDKNEYTGIPVIDFMMNYKFAEAFAKQIELEYNFDVYFCPIKDNQMCILLGNLIDNAIEANLDIEPDHRKIYINIQTVNNMFFMEIGNPYSGKRKKVNGRYIVIPHFILSQNQPFSSKIRKAPALKNLPVPRQIL